MDTLPTPRRLGLTASLLAFTVASAPALQATDIFWSSTAGTTTWATGTNWDGGSAPTNDLTTDIALFNKTSYTNQPTVTASTSVAGLVFGDGTTPTVSTAITINASQVVRIGASGILKQANSAATSFLGAGSLRLGSSQSWTNNSSTDLTIGSSGTSSSLANNSSASTLTLNGSGSGNIVINNVISNVNGAVSFNIGRTGSGVVIVNSNTTGNSGTTTVSSGVLLLNNTSGNGLGTGAVTVSSSGTLGGAGFIGGATTAAAGSFLAPGSASGVAGILTFNSSLDVSGLASGTGGLLFNLAGTTASDKIALATGVLSIGSGVLNFNDFDFTTLSGFGAGTYTLVDTSTSIVGTLGTNLTGTVGGLDAALSLANGGQDIILTVSAIPEPSTYATLFGVLALAGTVLRRNRSGSR